MMARLDLHQIAQNPSLEDLKSNPLRLRERVLEQAIDKNLVAMADPEAT